MRRDHTQLRSRISTSVRSDEDEISYNLFTNRNHFLRPDTHTRVPVYFGEQFQTDIPYHTNVGLLRTDRGVPLEPEFLVSA